MEKIVLTLRNAKLKSYHLMSRVLILMNFVIQLGFTFTDTYRSDRILMIILILLFLLLLFVKRRDRSSAAETRNSLTTLYVLICAIWIKWGLYWLAGINLLFDILYLYSIRKFEVLVMQDKIIYPSFLKREIRWEELQNLVWKDGILTIDFKNDKILQNETEEDNRVNEQEFNEFCREQLKK